MTPGKMWFIIPMTVLAIVAISKLWVFFLIAFLVFKFAGGGCRGKHAYSHCSRNKFKEPKQKPLYDDKDIVPDGQFGF